MGQRHQAFLIARVIPRGETEPRYRCVGAIHHQWCYGSLPARALLRFITLLKQEENQQVVREELASINGLYGAFGNHEPPIPDIPLPFTTFLFISAWTVDISDGSEIYVSDSGNLLDAGMGSSEGDNNDGITVIDITDPQSPAYCFVSIHGLGYAIEEIPLRTPLSAETYIWAYYPNDWAIPDDLFKASLAKILEQLEDVPVIPIYTLHQAWPNEYRIPPQLPDMTPTTTLPPRVTGVPSLADVLLKPAVVRAIQEGSFKALEPFISVTGKANIIKDIIKLQDHSSPMAITFLKQFIWAQDSTSGEQDSTSIDLSGFQLDETQLSEIFSGNYDFDAVKVLNLSHNKKLGIRSLKNVLSRLPFLQRLLILGTPISDQEIYNLIKTEFQSPRLLRAMEGLVHPAFLRFDVPLEAYPVALKVIVSEDLLEHISHHYRCTIYNVSIPYFAPDQILQALLDFFETMRRLMNLKKGRDNPTLCLCQATALLGIFFTQARWSSGSGTLPGLIGKPNSPRTWSERILPFVPVQQFQKPVRTPRRFADDPRWYFAFDFKKMQYGLARLDEDVLNEFYDRFQERLERNGIVGGMEDLAKRLFDPFVREMLDSKDGLAFKERLFGVRDVVSFFRELEREGRPSVEDREAAKALFGLVESLSEAEEGLESGDKQGSEDSLPKKDWWKRPKVMSGEFFYQFLAEESKGKDYYTWVAY